MSSAVLDIPLFPLPNALLFPRTLLPLHVFEPRYRKMITDCLDGDRKLAVGLLRMPQGASRAEPIQSDPPLTHRIVGIGAIVDQEPLDDGRSNIKVEGQFRATIVEEIPSEPYRTVRVEIMREFGISPRDELTEARTRLENELHSLADALPRFRSLIEKIFSRAMHPGILADLVAAHFVSDFYDRQCLLSECHVIRRVEMTAIQIERLNRRVRRAQRKAQ